MPTPSLFPMFLKAQSGGGSGLLGLIDAEVTSSISVEIAAEILIAEVLDSINAIVNSSAIQAGVSSPIVVEIAGTPIVTEIC